MYNLQNEIPTITYEQKLSEQLFTEHFDEILLISARSGHFIKTSEFLTGSLLGHITFDDRTFDEQADAIINELTNDTANKTLRAIIKLSNIKEKLETLNRYNTDIYSKSNNNGTYAYKRLQFEYYDDEKNIIVMIMKDFSDIIYNEIDPLTGLYNFMGFHRHVKSWIDAHPGQRYRIHRYDIDRFKDINGVCGFSIGNKLLRDIGHYMKQNDTENSFSAHLNADHFVRFCSEDSLSPENAYCGFLACFEKYDLKIPISIHVGVYDLCEPNCSSYTMSYKALLALQSEKGNFMKHIAYYEKGMMQVEFEHRELLKHIGSAIRNDEFEVWFQPQINYKNKTVCGAEALVRWRHPERGLIFPGDFIPLLERNDCIGIIDEYVIEKVCRYMRKWTDKNLSVPIIISVNLSRNDLYNKELCANLKKLTEKYHIPANTLRLEITESAYIDNPELLISRASELKNEGFIIEMDDFGSGYSSLHALKDIDIDILKLDMKFLSGSNNEKKSDIIISSVINMASQLGLPVIAEGIETKSQADFLLACGCKYMQGYYFSKPVTAAEYEKILEQADNNTYHLV